MRSMRSSIASALSGPVVRAHRSFQRCLDLDTGGFPRPQDSGAHFVVGLHRKSQFEQLCSTAVAVSASYGEPALLNCWFSEVNLEISWFKTCCCLRKVFIICTSSSSAAISFCADGHVNYNFSLRFTAKDPIVFVALENTRRFTVL